MKLSTSVYSPFLLSLFVLSACGDDSSGGVTNPPFSAGGQAGTGGSIQGGAAGQNLGGAGAGGKSGLGGAAGAAGTGGSSGGASGTAGGGAGGQPGGGAGGTSAGAGGMGAGTGGTSAGAGGVNGGTGGVSGGGAGGANAGAGGSGDPCSAPETTIGALNQEASPVDPGVTRLKGVVATTQKFLASVSKTGCLWSVFVTTAGAPAEYGSIQLISKGAPSVPGPTGKDVCSTDPGMTGLIPDDIHPGDVIDVSGAPAEFLSTSCGQNGTAKPAVGQRQLTDISCLAVAKKGGPAPEPRVLTLTEANQIAAGQNEGESNRKWGGALVKIEGSFPSTQLPATDFVGTSAVSKYGEIHPGGESLIIANTVSFSDLTCGGPRVSGKRYDYSQPTTFTSFTGVIQLSGCVWDLATRSICGDIAPASSLCSDPATCGVGGSGGAPSTEDSAALCSDGVDNDSDGFVDCNDKGCCGLVDCSFDPASYCGKMGAGGSSGGSENTTTLCSDGQDNDGDGFVDCNDKGCCGLVDCSSMPTSYCGKQGAGGAGGSSGGSENTAALCSNGVDDDGDTFIDCNDKDCCSLVDCSADPTSYCGKKGAGGAGGSNPGSENTVELCSNGIDDDGDTFIDCNDKGCCGVVSCTAMPASYCGKMGL